MQVHKIDSWLLGAIRESIGFPNVPYDLRRVKVLDAFGPAFGDLPDSKHPRDWLETAPGEFGLIGEMPKLHTLLFPTGRIPGGCLHVNDFSFLRKCRKLKNLDVSGTDFTDCALLAGIPELRSVKLPPREQLIHAEALEGLNAAITFVKKKWEQPAKPLQPVAAGAPAFPVLEPPAAPPRAAEKIAALVEEIRARSGIAAYRLRIDAGRKPWLTDSKFGGLPYWDPEKPYPLDVVGQPMQLLAQLNFETLGVGKPYPSGGLLQFFIPQQDDTFGCRFGDEADDFRIVYHERIDAGVTREAVLALGAPEGPCGDSPVLAERAVYAEPSTSYINDRAPAFEEIFAAAVKAAWGEDLNGQYSFDYLDEDDYNELFEALIDTDDGTLNGGHWLMGYPGFTQEDPRDGDSPYDTLLLQIDSAHEDDRRYSVLWGDCGVANFFIRRADLENHDFSDVLYNWDCC